MATSKKRTSTKKKVEAPVEEINEEVVITTEPTEVVEEPTPVEEAVAEIASEEVVVEPEIVAPVEEKKQKPVKIKAPIVETVAEPKYKIGSIVYVSKDADADLNGFKLFPQYKKCTYTVEAYDGDRGVYILRRLNLSLKLKEAFIVSPDERAHDSINRKQF